MTDRVQPGAIDSIVRNDELSQIFGQFSPGYVVPGSTPTPASERRSEIDETALDAFSLSGTTGFEVTIAPGEAFVGGWCSRDQPTSIAIDPNTTATIVVGWTPDAIFDPQIQSDRDEADVTIVAPESDTNPNFPTTPIFDVETDGSGIISTTDRRQIGPEIAVNRVETENELALPVFPTKSDVPNDLDEGTVVYVRDTETVFVEDGN
jgi:hypothetical protein